jgi:hypothetical protein
MKPLSRAVKDFQRFRAMKQIYQGSSERAATYRMHTFGGEPKDRFLRVVGGCIQAITAGDPVNVGPKPSKGASSTTVVEDFVVVDVPEF